jgi:undecaprenyl phosphate N,N'-diacetylbacillosamine 1-phosphate transferase
MYRFFLKRLLDFAMAFVALIVLLPFILAIIVLLIISNRGSVFFKQDRPGRFGKIFRVYKFKTMTDELDKHGKLLPDSARLTPVGKFVRSTSMDELPQLWNVLLGQMSFIGPRPLLVKYLPLYNTFQKRRHDVRPGITGWAQVNGRNAIPWEERFRLDVYYVDHLSFAFDIKIIFLTLGKVFKREGINATGVATMEPFRGNKNLQ